MSIFLFFATIFGSGVAKAGSPDNYKATTVCHVLLSLSSGVAQDLPDDIVNNLIESAWLERVDATVYQRAKIQAETARSEINRHEIF